jgi:hypothetical protein
VGNVRLWRGLLGVDKRTVIEDIEFSQRGRRGRAGGAAGAATKQGFAPLWASYLC